MTAKEYLERARTLDFEIKSKQRELTGIKINAQSLHSPFFGDKVMSSHGNNANRASDKAVDLENDIKEELSKLIDIKAEIHAKINGLANGLYVAVLTSYYIDCITLEELAEETNYSLSQIKRYRKKAVREFADLYGFVKDEPK